MKISKKAWMSTLTAGALALGVMGMTGEASAKYEATMYVAGMGGHFAKAVVEIDPTQAQPIKVKELTKVDIGDKDSHPVHDARIDNVDNNVLYWSTYKKDPATGKAHVGKTDLTTGQIIAQVDVDVDASVTNDKSLYCASGQSADMFLPITMTSKSYIDVFSKSDLSHVRRVFLEGTEGDPGVPYKFYHGASSNDNSKMVVTINEADKDHGTPVGKLHMIELDMAELVKGNVKVTNKTVVPGAEGKTVSFRADYSNDGSLIAVGAGDRVVVLNTADFSLKDAEMMGSVQETHDAIFTPDDKYLIATSRTKVPGAECADPSNPKDGEFTMDGHLMLYDVAAGAFVGEGVSVCTACHAAEGVDTHAVLCGVDANWSKIGS